MEPAGQPGPSGTCSLLGVPGFTSTMDLDPEDDEGEAIIGIRPKSSPLPRRKSSTSDEELELEIPPSGSRRVSFADAKGLSLVQVKEFGCWDVPKPPGYDSSSSVSKDGEEYFLSPITFSLPLSSEEQFRKVQEQKVELEAIELVPGTTILKGVIRVLNISFHKAVYVRTTLDAWSSHFDLLAEYIPGSSDSLTDCFLFKLTLVPPFGTHGIRVEFCLRYETPVGTFWANNTNRNYVLSCHQNQEKRKENPTRENMNKKSCLKTVGQNVSTLENNSITDVPSQEHQSIGVSKHEEEVDEKINLISDGRSGASLEDTQKLLAESRRNCGRRNRRKAAHVARKDFFAQRDRRTNDAERDGSPPEERQAAEEQTMEERLSKNQTSFDQNCNTEGTLFGSLEPTVDNLHDTSLTQDSTSTSEKEASESILSIHPRGEIITDKQDYTFHQSDDISPAGSQNITDSKAEENVPMQSQGQSAPADISAMCNPSLVSSSFTFRTVVAPLYHQAFDIVGTESQSVDDWGHPVQAADHDYPNTNGCETSCTLSTYARGNLQENPTETNQECLQSTPRHQEETETILDHEETLQDPVMHSDQRGWSLSEAPKTILEGTEATNRLHLQEEAQEDSQTLDLRSETTAGASETQTTSQTQVSPIIPQEALKDEHEAAIKGNYHVHGDTVEDASNDEEMIDSRKIQNQERDAAQKQNEFWLVDTAGEGDWEMMVEEEEKNMLKDEEKSQMMSSQADDLEVTDKDQREEEEEDKIATPLEDIDTEEPEKVKKEEEMLGKESIDEDENASEDNLGSIEEIRFENFGEEVDKESKYIKTTEPQKTRREEEEEDESDDETQMDKKREQEPELEKEELFAETHKVSTTRIDVQEEEEEVLIRFNNDQEGVAGVYQVNPREEDMEKQSPDHQEDILVDERSITVEEDSGRVEETLDILQDGPLPCEIHLYNEDNHEDAAARDEDESSLLFVDEPESDQWNHDGASSESDSDDEVELYMHCLRVVHTRTQPSSDKSIGFSVGRNKLLTAPMPSISECLDEEQPLSGLQDSREDPADSQTSGAALSASPGQPSTKSSLSWWIETFSWSNISKTLLFITMFVLFVGVAYHYDFFACFGLYLISVIWLCCQGEKNSAKNENKLD
ncbi:protein phosphatase 1 regulatory subunit 3A-like [Antennarius striatus]|uniref:protein phosphatase 1 regulatory subunit 3A-like n=1 Tax=Antennarius striatus TaxID=241820 RepID=UPI0035B08283